MPIGFNKQIQESQLCRFNLEKLRERSSKGVPENHGWALIGGRYEIIWNEKPTLPPTLEAVQVRQEDGSSDEEEVELSSGDESD